jgi:hypothetical protein
MKKESGRERERESREREKERREEGERDDLYIDRAHLMPFSLQSDLGIFQQSSRVRDR